MSKRNKFATSSVETEKSNGELTFVAARNVKNLNGWTYETSTLQAQDANGDYSSLSHEWQDVAIPLMLNHKGDTDEKVGNIHSARLISSGDEELVEMKAEWFKGEKAQQTRQRVLDNELTDVSITTDWGSGYADDDDIDVLKNAHIIEVSVVYAGAEPKAKILAKNSVSDDKDAEDEQEDLAKKVEDLEAENEELKSKLNAQESEDKESEDEQEKEEEMPAQPTNAAADEQKVADKKVVLNALSKLAQSGAIRGMNRSQVIEAVKNEVELTDGEGGTYVVPEAVFTEILAVTRPTDILQTFATVPVKRMTLMQEVVSDDDLARAGRWSKDEQKQIQENQVAPQKFQTEFLYKMQEISYADLQEDFGDLLLAYIRQELPQKVTEEEERAFIVGDGRAPSNPRHITAVVSLEEAAEDANNIHVYNYDGSGDASAVAAAMNGVATVYAEGTTYAVMNKATLGAMRAAGLSTAAGLPFSEDTVAGAIGVERIFTREYVPANVMYVWTAGNVKRLTGGNAGETIEQYDIDYNNRKIEFIRPVGGGAAGLYSAAKVTLPTTVSA